jgi:hypothetical protein
VVAVEETSPPAIAAIGPPRCGPATRSASQPASPTPATSTTISQISYGLSESWGPNARSGSSGSTTKVSAPNCSTGIRSSRPIRPAIPCSSTLKTSRLATTTASGTASPVASSPHSTPSVPVTAIAIIDVLGDSGPRGVVVPVRRDREHGDRCERDHRQRGRAEPA